MSPTRRGTKAAGWMSGLCGLQASQPTKQRSSDPTRNLYGCEPFGRVQIVLAAFVNDPKVALSRRVLIGDDSVDLVSFQ